MKSLLESQNEFFSNLFSTPTIDEFVKRNKEIDEMEEAHKAMEQEVVEDECICRKCEDRLICRYLHNDGEAHQQALCVSCAS